jgi:WD40 repeat protein
MVEVTVGSSAPVHGAPVSCVAFRADGARLASGSTDHTVRIWDTADSRRPVIHTTLPHSAAVTSVSWNPGAADVLATGTADGTVSVWRVVDDRPPSLMKALPGHPGAVTTVAWTPDGQHLLCLIGGGRMAVWNPFDEAFLGEIPDCVRLDVSPDGLVATAGGDGLISVRDLWRETTPLASRTVAAAEACAWSPGGDMLAVAGEDGSIEMFRPDLTPIRRIHPSDTPLRGLTWAPDGRSLIAGGYDGSLMALSMNRPLWRRTHSLVWPRSLAVGGTVVASATFAGRPHLLDLLAGGTIGVVADVAPPIADVSSVPFRGGVLAASGRVVTAGNGHDRRVLWEHDTRVGAVSALADRVVVSAAHRAIRLLVLAPGALTADHGVTLQAPEPVKTVAVLGSPSVPVVVAASYDFRLYAWTVDWQGPPSGPRLVGEFGAGIAALNRLGDYRLTATDNRGELVILALGEDGALSP